MAKSRVVWQGLKEHKDVLRNLPDTMTGEAARLAESTANSAAFDIRGAYPVERYPGTGSLREGVRIYVLHRGPYRTGRQVKNIHPLANIFESGTDPRFTASGAARGRIHPGRVFIPRIIKWRRRFTELLKASLVRNGASRVTGG